MQAFSISVWTTELKVRLIHRGKCTQNPFFHIDHLFLLNVSLKVLCLCFLSLAHMTLICMLFYSL